MEKTVIYIVRNVTSDGYEQDFSVIPDAGNGIQAEIDKWLEDGSLKEGDVLYKAEYVGKVEKQLVIKQPEQT